MAAAVASGPWREVFVSGSSRQVDVRSLEKELLTLWKSAAEAGEAGQLAPVTRAALLTLVVVVHGDEAAARATDMIGAITEHAPCRALLVNLKAKPDGPPLAAWASAHCHRVGSGRQVCCEQVTIEAAPGGMAALPSVIVPLLIPDLPVFIHWPEAFAEPGPDGDAGPDVAGLLADIAPAADYLVVDTARAANAAAALGSLAALIAPGRTRPDPRDLNWARLLPWREALADLFEPPERRSRLGAVTRIEIRASACSAGLAAGLMPARPLLLLAWLMDRLEWSGPEVTAGSTSLAVTSSGGRAAALRLAGEAGPRGRIEAVALGGADGFRVEVTRLSAEQFGIRLVEPGGAATEQQLSRRVDGDDRLLCGEIDRRGGDPVLHRALRLAARLAGAEAGP